jgi:hypothetical protein
MATIALQTSQVFQIPRIGQGIEIDHLLVAIDKPVDNKITAYESGSAGNKYGHKIKLL